MFIPVSALLLILSEVCSCREIHWKKVPGRLEKCGLQPLNVSRILKSKTDCAIVCSNSFNCRSFMYNKTTKLCTLYKGFSAYSEPPKSVLGDVYVADACEAYLDFSQKPIVQLFIPSTIFVAYIYQALSYQDALATCGCLQSTMFTVKTMDRYTFLIAQEGLKYYEWVGLDDIKTEGTFLWADDGKKFTDLALEKLLFDFGQPDNGHNIVDEDCVIKKRLEDITAGKLNDVSCNLTAFFICEKVNC
ncbi:uncharacterized protein LOC106058559 [Biomphalaria glabrata]|uniref:Uncharacterized protein LOC106058559 n=1 Tax=Biomphalaria glabrata TaxID=6526 RepID=A0A9U8E3R6_BIOGL|nr:uncharacterized protein LOC106058559 [Biomphalaria glabrata]